MPNLPPDVVMGLPEPDDETALQVGARLGTFPSSDAPSLERFPYYTAFPFGWYPVGLSPEFEARAVETRRRLARDLVVWRTETGSVAVVGAHCPHRGAHLGVGGEVRGCELVCPYHHWSWSPEGRNVSIPYRDEPAPGLRLRTYPTVETGGFVFFWYHPDPGQEPLFDLPDLDEYTTGEWSELDPFVCEYRCPWQEVAENFPDNVHLRTVHGALVVPTTDELHFEEYRHRLRASFTLDTAEGRVSATMTTVAHGPGLSVVRASGVVESVLFLTTVPIDWERTMTLTGYRIAPSGTDRISRSADRALRERLRADLVRQWSEDIAIFDNKVHTPELGSAPEDEVVREYRAWCRKFYVDGDPVAAGRVPPGAGAVGV